jgi:hypothetical protein
MKRVLARLGRTGPRELAFRAGQSATLALEALRFSAGREGWRQSRLQAALRPCSRELEAAGVAASRGRFSRAHVLLRLHFEHRASRFPIDPSEKSRIVASIRSHDDGAADAARRRAEPILQHRYDLLGYQGLSFESGSQRIDWHRDPVHQRNAPVRFWSRVPYLDSADRAHV